MSFFSKLKSHLTKTSSKLTESVKSVFTKKKLDQETLDDLCDVLISHDLGVDVAQMIVQDLRAQKFDQDIHMDDVKAIMAQTLSRILEPCVSDRLLSAHFSHAPHVIVMLGVNGTGKTTTMAKLARQFQMQGKRVEFAAADTFRAAAVDQLSVWAHRLGVFLYQGAHQADPASVAYQAFQHAQESAADILMVDTAGRLHNKNDLMHELTKIYRVLGKIDASAPHDVIMVLDATVGQNALLQVEAFLKAVPITGLMITKLDGTARGGIVVALAQKYKLPIYAIGVGESAEDLQPFDPVAFSRSLVGL